MIDSPYAERKGRVATITPQPRFFRHDGRFQPLGDLVRVIYDPGDLSYIVSFDGMGEWVRIWPEWTKGFIDTLLALVGKTPREKFLAAFKRNVMNPLAFGPVLETEKAPSLIRYRVEASAGISQVANGWLWREADGVPLGLFFDKWDQTPGMSMTVEEDAVSVDISQILNADRRLTPVASEINLDPTIVPISASDTRTWFATAGTWAIGHGAATGAADASWRIRAPNFGGLDSMRRTISEFDTSAYDNPAAATFEIYGEGKYGTNPLTVAFAAAEIADITANTTYGGILTEATSPGNYINSHHFTNGVDEWASIDLLAGDQYEARADFQVCSLMYYDYDNVEPPNDKQVDFSNVQINVTLRAAGTMLQMGA